MGLFWFGALCGGVTMFLTMVLVSAQAVDEKERQIEYLKKQLRLQAVQAKGVHDEY